MTHERLSADEIRGSSVKTRCVNIMTVLDRDLGKADTDSTNIATKDITTIQRLPGTYSVIQTFKVDCQRMNIRTPHDTQHSLNPQFLCVNTLADSIGP
jgi:hypothetical protein